MSRQILLDSSFGLVRTAIAHGTHLVDYYEESPEQSRIKGNIYRGVVKRVDGNLQAAFIRFSAGRDGFLSLRDADTVSSVGGTVKVGDSILIQVVKDEVGDKGAALTAKLSYSGRYLVFVPGRNDEDGISSRVSDTDRVHLKKILEEIKIPASGSIILRTAAIQKGIVELQKDLDRLSEAHKDVQEKFVKAKEMALLFQEALPALRYLREYYHSEVAKIWVNDEMILGQCQQFFQLYEPASLSKLNFSNDGPLMFQKLGLEAAVDQLSARKITLPSGANIVIDQTEALVAIDVNSAKAGGRGEEGRSNSMHEETVFAINKEAAIEIARQLRLRDLGGIIVVDFIDMEDSRHCRQVEELIRRSLSADKAKVKAYDISPLGTMQISRQRLRKAGPNFSKHFCDACDGKGWQVSPAAGAFSALRKMEEVLTRRPIPTTLQVSAPFPIANQLLNTLRDQVLSLENRYSCSIQISALPRSTGDVLFPLPLGGKEVAHQVRHPVQNTRHQNQDTGMHRKEGEGNRRRRSHRGREHQAQGWTNQNVQSVDSPTLIASETPLEINPPNSMGSTTESHLPVKEKAPQTQLQQIVFTPIQNVVPNNASLTKPEIRSPKKATKSSVSSRQLGSIPAIKKANKPQALDKLKPPRKKAAEVSKPVKPRAKIKVKPNAVEKKRVQLKPSVRKQKS